MRRVTISLALLIFFSFSSLASVEQLTPSLEGESQTSLWTDEKDLSSETNRGRRVLKRSQRGKSSLKSLPAVDKPAYAFSLIVRMRRSIVHSSFFQVESLSADKRLQNLALSSRIRPFGVTCVLAQPGRWAPKRPVTRPCFYRIRSWLRAEVSRNVGTQPTQI